MPLVRSALVAVLATIVAPAAFAGWRTVAPGLDLGRFTAKNPSSIGDSEILVLRVDPRSWEFVVLCAKDFDGKRYTASEWAERHGLVAATNAGMFATDGTTHVGFLADGNRVNSSHVNHYESVAAFGSRRAGARKFRIYDLDAEGVSLDRIRADHRAVVQNLRLIKRPGENRWPQQKKKWSEAALGEDSEGRALFLFTRSPFTMHDLNRELLRLDVDLVAAQHLEGGPEAQLAIRLDELDVESFGSYETDFHESDGNSHSWPVPNVIGIVPKAAAAESAEDGLSAKCAGLLGAALERTTRPVTYDSAYRSIPYPGGDVPDEVGVCTDLVVRSYRALGIDLQVKVHEDMTASFDAYPKNWGLSRPDPNIDHRRVPNLRTFFRRAGAELPVSGRADDYRPGDLVTWRLPSGVPHIGIVSDRRSGGGERFQIVHNIGAGPTLEDVLFAYEITGHYRYALDE